MNVLLRIALSMFVCSVAIAEDAPKHTQALQGTWVLSHGVFSGKSLKQQLLKEGVGNLEVNFSDDVMTMSGGGSPDHTYQFTLDPATDPKSMQLVTIETRGKAPKGSKLRCIYKIDGKELTLCMPADSSVDPPKDFSAPEGSRLTFLVLARDAAGTAVAAKPIAEEDAKALQFANQALAALDAERLSMEAGAKAGLVSKTRIDELRSELFDARLILLRLQGDEAGITMLLQDEIKLEKARFERLKALASQGYVGAGKLREGELRLLSVQQQHALHERNQTKADEVLRRALEIEQQHLQRLESLSSQGVANRSVIAQHKLRIARLLADRQIETAECQ
ncbi:TIGR03067 domain-containing protein [Stieleria sp. ICT_E10.1]|uniref:TIGR03067 domain-containing protein n=1 Tax=Stieleria sedimenti TaxID=2976331 RepID=UPI0021801492|nr:TIGR03067 domain-containing protein [Stieleria sedimenti]MCS7468742.1 TIGR03067 domain-containing protein [Stieleria sedimenti]